MSRGKPAGWVVQVTPNAGSWQSLGWSGSLREKPAASEALANRVKVVTGPEISDVLNAGAGRGGRDRFGRGGRFRRSAEQESADSGAAANDSTPSVTAERSRGRGSNPKVNALIELLESIGPAVVLVHSAAGPTESTDIKQHFADKRLIAIYRDSFDLRPMQGRYEASLQMVKEIQEAGGDATMIWLPQKHIHGNCHLLMQDNNNADIAKMIQSQLRAKQSWSAPAVRAMRSSDPLQVVSPTLVTASRWWIHRLRASLFRKLLKSSKHRTPTSG